MNVQQAVNYLRSSGFSEEQILTIANAFTAEVTNMHEMIFRLTMYKNGKYFLAQSFDTLNLARKAGNYFLSTSEQDGISRGYVITDERFNLEILTKGDIGRDHDNENG